MNPKLTSMSRRRFVQAAGAGLALGAVLPAAASAADAADAGAAGSSRTETAIRPARPAVATAARPLPLTAVRLTGGPLKHAQDLDAAYLLKIEPDRVMAPLRERAGLTAKAPGYGGWDGGGRNLTGHIAGHYLSAVSLMYAATGDDRFRARAEYLVDEMAEVQKAGGDGYIGALRDDKGIDGKLRFEALAKGEIRSGGFDLNGLWSPWYVQHKLFAGLRDAYRHAGVAAALPVEAKFAAWVESVVGPLDEAQTQKMLATEFGGMNEVLADLYGDTGDRRWLRLSDKFEHHAVVDPLARREDKLGGLHGNTQVPKLLGSLTRYVWSGAEADGTAARYFWDAVVRHHSFATGGHGKDEYFGPPDELSERVDGRTDESCNVYNMLKMTRVLFALQPDVRYAEYMERALFNHVLGSIDPQDGRTCYMVPVGRGVRHEYQRMFEDFTCCVGTGMESHALHADGLYYESGDRLWVNFYAPTTAEWKAKDVRLTLETGFPEGETATLTVRTPRSRSLTLSLRRPSWTGDGFSVRVNGKEMPVLPPPGAYVDLKRTWKDGDRVEIALPKTLRAEPLPDNPRRVALLHGPLVLSGDLGPEEHAAPTPIPIFVAAGSPVAEWLAPVPDAPGCFAAADVARDSATGEPTAVRLVPFYRLHRRAYAAYWDLYTADEWRAQAESVAADRARQEKLAAATVAFAQPGEMQPERDYHQQGERTEPDRLLGRAGRRARGWFSFDLPVDPAHPLALVVTYNTQELQKRAFDVLVDGRAVASETIERTPPGSAIGRFYDARYPLPADLVAGKQKVTVRFQATGGHETGCVYGIRIVRADAGV